MTTVRGPPRLSASGTRLVSPDGREVILRGVALGGWLFNETWMTGIDYPTHGRLHALGVEAGLSSQVDAVLRELGPAESAADSAAYLERFEAALSGRTGADPAAALAGRARALPTVVDDSDRRLRELLERRFGTGGRDELYRIWAERFLSEEDVAFIAAQGFNAVRIPMGYRALVRNSDLAPLAAPLVWNEDAFAALDRLLGWCEAHGLWAILDLQESPGGHNGYTDVPATLYVDPAMQELTVALWTELSARYGNRDAVAAYSLLAEPWAAPDRETAMAFYARLVRAIRANGDDHLCVLHDGFDGVWTLPAPEEHGLDGVVYSMHVFETGARSASDYRLMAEVLPALLADGQARQGVPYFIGSFSTIHDEDWAYEGLSLLLDAFGRGRWSWSLWTYRRLDDPLDAELYGTSTAWGIFSDLAPGATWTRPDPHLDSFEALADAFGRSGSGQLAPNERLLERLAAHLPLPGARP